MTSRGARWSRTGRGEPPGPDPEPQCAPLTPYTVLMPGRMDCLLKYDVLTGTWVAVTDGVGGVFGEGIVGIQANDGSLQCPECSVGRG